MEKELNSKLEEGDFPQVIKLTVECLGSVNQLKGLMCLSEYKSRLQV